MSYMVRRDPLRANQFITQSANRPQDLGQPLYDRVEYPAAGCTEMSFFSTVKGQSATLISAGATGTVTKSHRDTNMDTANVAPNKQFEFVAIGMYKIHEDEGEAANPADRDKIRAAGYLHVKVVDQDVLYLPILAIPEGNPIITNTMNSSMGATSLSGCSIPMFPFRVPLTLEAFQQLTVKLVFPATVTTTKAVDILLMLHGYMRRPS